MKIKEFVISLFLSLLVIILLPIIILFRFIYHILIFFKILKKKPDQTFDSVKKIMTEELKCTDCKPFVRSSFKTYHDWDKFEVDFKAVFNSPRRLNRLYCEPDYKFLGIEFGTHSINGSIIYECKSCKTKWELSYPENTWRGYFIPLEWNDKCEKYVEPVES